MYGPLWLLRGSLAFGLGVLLISSASWSWWFLVALTFLFWVPWPHARRQAEGMTGCLMPLFLIFSLVLLGMGRAQLEKFTYEEALQYKEEVYQGQILIEEVKKPGTYVGRLQSPPYGLVILYGTEEGEGNILPGMILVGQGQLALPAKSMNDGSFSYRDYLRDRRIYFILDGGPWKITGVRNTLNGFLHRYRINYLKKLEAVIGEEVRYVDSIFLGKQDGLSEDERADWKLLGISHLQAVSGSQVGALLELLLLLFVISPGPGWWKKPFFLMGIMAYGLLTSTPSVWRAIAFFLLVMLFEGLGWEKQELSLMVFSGVLLVLWNSRVVFQVAFQLSYIIALGVILFGKLIRGEEPWIRKVLPMAHGELSRTLLTGVVSVAFSFPVLLWHFQALAPGTIIATPIIAPVVQGIILIGAFFLFFPMLIGYLVPLVHLMEGIIWVLNRSVEFLARLPFPMIQGAPWPLEVILCWYGFWVGFSFLSFRTWLWRRWRWFTILTIGVAFLWGLWQVHPKSYLEVDFINVGQGDAILVVTPDPKRVILIDGGRSFGELDMGRREVLPFLRRKGIRRIDLLVSTHGDNDHMGGLGSVMEEMPVGQILIPPLAYDIEGDYDHWGSDYGNLLVEAREGLKISLGPVILEVLGPKDGLESPEKNATSVLLSLSIGESSILLTGDCELETMKELAREASGWDVVKAPHHGSRQSWSEGLYGEMDARLVIFSVGMNTYGHPSSELLEDLNAEEIPYLRTDRRGTLSLRLYGDKILANGSILP